MSGERRPKVQFRLEDETYMAIEDQVQLLKERDGVAISPDAYCRALVLAALQQPKQQAIADEIVLRVHSVKQRIATFIGEVLDENMDNIILSALSDQKVTPKR